MQLADSEVKLSLIHPPCCGEILGGSSQNIFWGQPCEKGYKKAKFQKKMQSVEMKKIQNKIYKNTTWETRCYNLAHPGPGNCVTIANRCHCDLKQKILGEKDNNINWRKKNIGLVFTIKKTYHSPPKGIGVALEIWLTCKSFDPLTKRKSLPTAINNVSYAKVQCTFK